jgi:GH24 family phage-related lysozyme (muramidase)
MADTTTLKMSLGTEGLKLIQDFETFQSKLYDTDGGGHCTVGWGHLVHIGKCEGRENEKIFLSGITQEKGDGLLKKDTKVAEDAVNKKVGALGTTLAQNQFDALVSFTYNVGTGNLANILTACTGADGKLDLSKIPDKMKLYDKSSGKILAGLTRRRQREAELFNK